MKVVSVNVGLPRDVFADDEWVRTSIWKSPVEGPVPVRLHNLDGDRQSDVRVHGGRDKAVYAYPSEHYEFWRTELGESELPWGAFGENLTTEGCLEHAVQVGDRFHLGTAVLQVTQPRLPCFKLGIRFARPDMVKRFLRSGRTGFYLAIVHEGRLAAGDTIRHEPAAASLTISELVAVHTTHHPDETTLRRAIDLPFLSEAWKEQLRKKERA